MFSQFLLLVRFLIPVLLPPRHMHTPGPFSGMLPFICCPHPELFFAPLASMTSSQTGSYPGLCSEEGILHMPSSTFLFVNSVLSVHLFSVFHLFSNLLCVKSIQAAALGLHGEGGAHRGPAGADPPHSEPGPQAALIEIPCISIH